MLEIQNLTKLYGENQGIQNFSLRLKSGSICAIIGHNGSGKSTLFKGILQLIDVDTGSVLLRQRQPHKLDFGYMPENRSVILDLKTTELIELIGKLKKMDPMKINEKIDEWMKVLRCEALKDKKLKACSKGNQQKIQLICALIHDPHVLILDEPFSGLDIESTRVFQRVISLLKKRGKIILLSSHRFDEIESLCDQICVIKQSRVVQAGTLEDLKAKTNRYTITLSNDSMLFYKHEPGVVDVIIDGNLTHYVFDDGKQCESVAKYMVNERNHRTLKVASLTLDDLYGEL